jgi:hypothetical protein
VYGCTGTTIIYRLRSVHKHLAPNTYIHQLQTAKLHSHTNCRASSAMLLDFQQLSLPQLTSTQSARSTRSMPEHTAAAVGLAGRRVGWPATSAAGSAWSTPPLLPSAAMDWSNLKPLNQWTTRRATPCAAQRLSRHGQSGEHATKLADTCETRQGCDPAIRNAGGSFRHPYLAAHEYRHAPDVGICRPPSAARGARNATTFQHQ